MSEIVGQNTPVPQHPAAPEKSRGINTQMVVVGILGLLAAMLLAWQFIGCANCYAGFYTGT